MPPHEPHEGEKYPTGDACGYPGSTVAKLVKKDCDQCGRPRGSLCTTLLHTEFSTECLTQKKRMLASRLASVLAQVYSPEEPWVCMPALEELAKVNPVRVSKLRNG